MSLESAPNDAVIRLFYVILATEADRPLTIPLLVLGAGLALIGLAWVVHGIWMRVYHRKARKLQIEEWTALAQARGFEVDAHGVELVMRGTVASRPFELDSLNFFHYGMDSENALRFRVEDADATFAISGWDDHWTFGDRQPPVGDEAFDKRYRVRANGPGLRRIARFGPKERQLLVEFSEFDVDQMEGQVRIRMPYRIDLAHLDAACRLVESVWGPPPHGKGLSESGPAD
ncbi:MAG: hypothetical protein ACKVXR_11860 [Planctomycetota bacterium]